MKHPLLLGIDASRSVHAAPTGVERYSTEIIRALLNELKDRTDVSIRLYTPRAIPSFPERLQRILWFPRLWSLLRLSWEMLWHKPNLLFVPAHVLPFFAPKRSFVTVHDLAFLKIPSAYSWKQRWYLKWSTRRAVKKCEQIFVPSEAVKNDVESFYKAKNVCVIPHGPLTLSPTNELERSGSPLFFFIGRLEAKKNIGTLLLAWERFFKKSSGLLALVGRVSPDFVLPNAPHVQLYGYLEEADVSRLFHTATALVFPSLEEGFGFPLLQAFEAGCPVICSDIPALREVGGDAALYVNPHDANGFAKTMLTLAGDKKLRETLAVRGKKRLKQFSWGKAAKAVCKSFFRDA